MPFQRLLCLCSGRARKSLHCAILRKEPEGAEVDRKKRPAADTTISVSMYLQFTIHFQTNTTCPKSIHITYSLISAAILLIQNIVLSNNNLVTLVAWLRACLHLRFPIRIPIRLGVPLAAKGVKQVNFWFLFAEMCKQTIVMGARKRIVPLFSFLTNRARNRMAIRTQIRTRVDSP
jgi:hypothetical protein